MTLTVELVSAQPMRVSDSRALRHRIDKAIAANEKLNSDVRMMRKEFTEKLDVSMSRTESLKLQLEAEIEKNKALENQIETQLVLSKSKADEQFRAVDRTISRNTLLLILGSAFVLGLSFLLHFVLRRKIQADRSGLIDKIQQTRTDLEEEGLQLDNKLVELLATQMELQREQTPINTTPTVETDHTLALKVADEIVRIEKNLSVMDPETRGVKQLAASVRRIQDNFAAKGYELVEMLHRPYDPGMNVIANLRSDENLKQNEQIITRIIKPQVNYKGVMIQTAQIEVSQGE